MDGWHMCIEGWKDLLGMTKTVLANTSHSDSKEAALLVAFQWQHHRAHTKC